MCAEFNSGDRNYLVLTHSPYIVDHLGNLMYAHETGLDVSECFVRGYKDSFMDSECVEVFEFVDGNFKNILSGININWQSFSSVSDLLLGVWSDIEECEEK